MCGIAGLYLKNVALQPQLGALLAEMLEVLSDRGPDSAGFAIYRDGDSSRNKSKLTFRAETAVDMTSALSKLGSKFEGLSIAQNGTHAVIGISRQDEPQLVAYASAFAGLQLVSSGERIEIYKEVGHPSLVSHQFNLAAMGGSHAIGHTRMATESAVTTWGAHPFSTGRDQCLVHNGSLSNHNGVRRRLAREGLHFETDNDSEVAAAYLTWKMREGASLGDALRSGLNDLDGFYTFVVGTERGFAVLRDPIACKPAVMAETEDYVAFGSEYRALAGLPGIAHARVFEPEPATVYVWERG